MSQVASNPSKEDAISAVRTLLAYIGDNPDRPGLIDTPERVVRMYEEVFCGLRTKPPRVAMFPNNGNDQMVALAGIPFTSFCEHHIVPFVGTFDIGYLPFEDGKIVGLSKLARIARWMAQRPQVQEALTSQVADMLFDLIKPRGLIVVCNAEHSCMALRGVQVQGAVTMTSAIRGDFDKVEFFELLKLQSR